MKSIALAFAMLLSTATFASAEYGKVVPPFENGLYGGACNHIVFPKQTYSAETYTGEDLGKLTKIGASFPGTTKIVVVLVGGKGTVYFLDENDCVIYSADADEGGVNNVMATAGVKRVPVIVLVEQLN